MAPGMVAYANPDVLVWAREASGFTISDAADAAKIKATKLEGAEAGAEHLSFPELERLAAVYARTVALFFIDEPPAEPAVETEFRRLRDAPALPWGPSVRHVVRVVSERQVEAVALLEALELEPVWPTVELPELTADPEAFGQRLREVLDVANAGDQARLELRDWVDMIERLGILVMQTKDLGAVEVSRGFVAPHPTVPVIVLNSRDDRRARIFTALHELAHLLAATAGLAGTNEEFFERAAGAALMPVPPFEIAFAAARQREGILGGPDIVAAKYGVTPRAAAVRARQLGLLTIEDLIEIIAHLDLRRAPQSKGGDYYRNMLTYLGPGYTQLVLSAFDAHLVNYTTASGLLDVKASNFQGLRQVLRNRVALV